MPKNTQNDLTYSYTVKSKKGKVIESGAIFSDDAVAESILIALRRYKNTISKITIKVNE